jgi:hypothetical protein
MDPDIVVAVYRSQERLLEARLEHRRARLARQGAPRRTRLRHAQPKRTAGARR